MKNILVAVLLLVGLACAADDLDPRFPPHTARNALDWAGNYEGLLPAADCPGLEVVLTLNKDGTYSKTVMFVERDVTPNSVTGSFTWVDGSRISLKTAGTPEYYFVAEQALVVLMADGRPVTGNLAERFKLKKI